MPPIFRWKRFETLRDHQRGFNPEAMSTIEKPHGSSALPMPAPTPSSAPTGLHTLLGMWVRDRQMISMEQAIHKLTFHVASIWGIEGRGLLRPGFAADVTVFDPKTIKACAPEWADDYPAATKRLIQRSEGVHYTIVNGKVIFDEGKLSGEMAGSVLRSAAIKVNRNSPRAPGSQVKFRCRAVSNLPLFICDDQHGCWSVDDIASIRRRRGDEQSRHEKDRRGVGRRSSAQCPSSCRRAHRPRTARCLGGGQGIVQK
jgi:hypothetical protein